MNNSLKQLALPMGPIMAVLLIVFMHFWGFAWPMTITAAIALLCAIWWIFEPIPIPATSLIPLAAFPAAGVLDASQVAAAYGHWLILLLLGGFILSVSLEKSGTHKRLAMGMIRLVGGKNNKTISQKRIILGFMLASAGLSMWISNTATTLMLVPVAIAIIQSVNNLNQSSVNQQNFAVALILGLGYAASVGGMGTPIGTPPNTLFLSIYEQATLKSLSFLDWMQWAMPVVILMLPLIWLWLTRHLKQDCNFELPNLGKWRLEEKRTLAVFIVTAFLWIFRKAPFGGWSELLGLDKINDASVALFAVIAMFLIPNGKKTSDGQSEKLLDWQSANKIPWGVLLLFAGGLAIAAAFKQSGLSNAIGSSLSFVAEMPLLLTLVLICLLVTFLTELTSNTATTALLMPILAAVGNFSGIDPAIFMVPAAISASCAFMLPVATGPNAVIFSTEKVTVAQMARNGFALNIIGVLVISSMMYLLIG